ARLSHMGERSCEELSFLSAGGFAIEPNMTADPNAAHKLNTGLFRPGFRGRLHKVLRLFRIYSASAYIFARLTIRLGGQIFNAMRILLFITLMLSMAVAPAAALASCVSMGSDMEMAQISSDDAPVKMAGMVPNDCADMDGAPQQSHDAGCLAACALVCPGFYSVPAVSVDQEPAFRFVQYAIPPIDPGLATLSRLDPPPPRI
ncbi:MAG TPA: hypothetical protein P5072_16230, partial [Parvularculaceae bacterium]|nr:hypothetical protein [Parvularculaceae bacterium]